MSDFIDFWTFNEHFLDVKSSCKTIDSRFEIVDGQVSTEILVPITILKGKSCGRTLISYLKSKGLSFSDIARILNRNPRTIWSAYQKAESESYFNDNEILVPVNIFSYRGLSILESIVFWLKSEKNMNYVQISKLLGKNYQTIRTVYMRALKKIGGAIDG